MLTATRDIDQESFDILRHCIEKEAAIALGDDKKYLIETRLRGLLAQEGCSSWPEFIQKARNDSSHRIRELVIDAMTTNETLWFRDSDPYDVLREVLLPRWADEIRKGQRKKIRLWCAACSTGQEPYSVMITALEYMRGQSTLQPGHLEILASDISDTALVIARSGRYNSVAMSRGMPAELRARYFREEGRVSIVLPEVARNITFRQFNLQNSFSLLGKFDVVLNRYVSIYFSDDFKRELYRKIHGVLKPQGVLFLGSSESMTGFSEGFVVRRQGKAVFHEAEGISTRDALTQNLEFMRSKVASPGIIGRDAERVQAATTGTAPVSTDLTDVIARLKALNAKATR